MYREERLDVEERRSRRWPRATAYAAAAALAVVAEAVREVLRASAGTEESSLLLFLFFPPVLAAALWLGFGPGLVCATISALLVAWWLPPAGSFLVGDSRDVQTLALFAVSAALVCALLEQGRRGKSLVRDASQRIRSERQRRESAGAAIQDREARLEAILNTAVGGILTIDGRGTVESMNAAAERMFGYSAAEVVGRNVSLLMPAPYREEHDRYLAHYLATGEKKIIGKGREVVGRRKDGSTFPLHLAVSEVPVEGERHFTGFLTDLSEQKRLEHEFLQSQKLEAVGSLAGGIAHDFNNLLMGIMACSRMAGAELEPGSSVRGLFDEIAGAAGRGVALTRRLLAFSRRQPVRLRATSINGVVRENEGMLRQLLGEDVALHVELAPSGALVQADDGLIEQILVNLLVNARDAMPDGGAIAVTTRDEADGRVALEVRDTGCGMPPEVLARIFEPFFSTKSPEKGTGLGLSTVKRIVVQLSGSIEVESELGVGSTFRLRFARSEVAVDEIRPAARRPAVEARGRTVLLVEDDRLVRIALRLFLERKGYRVLAADGGAQAHELAREAPIDVLLTDMVLPDAAGDELAGRIRSRSPATRVIFMSAHPAETLVERGRLEPDALFLEKPFEMEDLEILLARALEPGPAVP
jgi:PAS domain S-box-containing protein